MFAFASAMSLLCTLSACGKDGKTGGDVVINIGGNYEKTVDGSGKMSTNDFQIPDGQNYKLIFSGVSSTNSSFTVNIASSGSSAAIEADDNVIGDFNLDVNEQTGTIIFSADNKNLYNNVSCTVSINAAVTSVEADGAAVLTYNTPENADSIGITLSGACSMTAAGTANSAVYEVTGASVLKAYGLAADSVTVSLSGTSNAEVHADGVLKAEAAGTSSIIYSGDPDTVNKDASGTASITKRS